MKTFAELEADFAPLKAEDAPPLDIVKAIQLLQDLCFYIGSKIRALTEYGAGSVTPEDFQFCNDCHFHYIRALRKVLPIEIFDSTLNDRDHDLDRIRSL